MNVSPVSVAITAVAAVGHAPVRSRLQQQIARYCYRFRRRVWRFVSEGSRNADLVFSFPAAVVAIVSRPAGDRQRRAAEALVAAGAPLVRIAEALGLPGWMRKLPAEAIVEPLDDALPIGWQRSDIGRVLLGAMPGDCHLSGRWLQAVIGAGRHGDEAFVTWLASQRYLRRRRMSPLPVRLLALFAWYSGRRETPAGALVPIAWHSEMSLERAVGLAPHWMTRALHDLCHKGECGGAPWGQRAMHGDLAIVPLTSCAAIADEASVMRNCLNQYVPLVVSGQCRLYSVRHGAEVRATAEIRLDDNGVPRICQLSGPANAKPDEEVLAAVRNWLLEVAAWPGVGASFRGEGLSGDRFGQAIWAPFASAIAASTGLVPSAAPSIDEVERELAQLRRFARL